MAHEDDAMLATFIRLFDAVATRHTASQRLHEVGEALSRSAIPTTSEEQLAKAVCEALARFEGSDLYGRDPYEAFLVAYGEARAEHPIAQLWSRKMDQIMQDSSHGESVDYDAYGDDD